MTEINDSMRVVTLNASTVTTLQVGGEIDLATAATLGEHLESATEAGSGDVRVDMAEVVFIDSTGLHVLVSAHQQLQRQGRQLLIINPTPTVLRVLAVSGLAGLFGIDDQR